MQSTAGLHQNGWHKQASWHGQAPSEGHEQQEGGEEHSQAAQGEVAGGMARAHVSALLMAQAEDPFHSVHRGGQHCSGQVIVLTCRQHVAPKAV